MKKKLTLEQNGGEYYQGIVIECDSFEQVDKETIIVNGAKIKFDEDIIEVEDLE
jgi:hypothetical protein